MTLAEALQAKRLMYLIPFHGWRKCRGLTGLYYYDTVTSREDEQDIKVQVRTAWFSREWVNIHNLKEIKEAK